MANLPKGISAERNEGVNNLPGIYVHKESGAKFVTSDGDEGSIQADALLSPVWKDGWERIGDVPSRVELLEMRKTQEQKDAKAEKTEEVPAKA